MTTMRRKNAAKRTAKDPDAGGWTNNETHLVVSTIENNRMLHETIMLEASLAITKALEDLHLEAFSKSEQRTHAIAVAGRTLGITIRRRYTEFFREFAEQVFKIARKLRPDEMDMAGTILELGRHAMLERVDWGEIGRHYATAFMG